MNFLLMLLAGSAIGWLAGTLTRTRQPVYLYVFTGVLGSLLSGLLLGPLFGVGTISAGDFSLPSLLISLTGSILLLLIFRILSKGLSRRGPQGDENRPAPPAKQSSIVQEPAPPTVRHSIFLSYRRDDAPDAVGRIYDRLVQRFGKDCVFKDIDSIPFGVDFRKHLSTMLSRCSLVLVVVGPNWNPQAPQSGKRRLDQPQDFVRIEIEAALQRDIPIIPLILKGAAVPAERDLPASLQDLVYRQGMFVRPDPDFHRDMNRLIERIEPDLAYPPTN